MNNINKISIIGGPGTGKSTLTKNLSKEMNIPAIYIDGIHHLENWKQRDKTQRDNIILEKIKEDKWIIDGTYKSTLEKRVQKSDLIVYLNYSKIARLKGIVLRYLKNRGKEKEEIPGCKEKIDWRFIKFTIRWDTARGITIKEILERNKNKNILIIKKRKELNKWYKEEFNKKIEL